MIERIVEHWLTKAGERGFETPFVHLLTAEGYKVLHAPAHHPQEHGKDLIAISPSGELCAFQLKGTSLDLKEFEQHSQGQLLALLASAIIYPGVEPPRPPDRAFLVTTGSLSPPVRGRLEVLNAGNAARKVGALECVEKEQLVARFIKAHGHYLPSEPRELNDLLHLLLNTGRGFFNVPALSNLLNKTIGAADSENHREFTRAVSSAVLFTSYATGPWEKEENHLAVAQGWLVLCAGIVHYAARYVVPEKYWSDTFTLAFAAAQKSLGALIQECDQREDLIIPDLAESLVYPTRALLVCGYVAAAYLSQSTIKDALPESVKRILLRELPFIRLTGEAGWPALFLIATALEKLGQRADAAKLIARWVGTVVRVNAVGSADAVPDPYHSHEDCLRRSFGADVPDSDERFDGNSYSLHVGIEWLARREARVFLTQLWPAITRITFCEFEVSTVSSAVWPDDPNGSLRMWQAPQPQSWGRLVNEARSTETHRLPQLLFDFPDLMPFVGLLFPERFTAELARAIDQARELHSVAAKKK